MSRKLTRRARQSPRAGLVLTYNLHGLHSPARTPSTMSFAEQMIFNAIEDDDADALRSALASFSSPDAASDVQGRSPILAACEDAHPKALAALLDAGADPHARGCWGNLLTAAAAGGDPECVRMLLARGVDAEAIDSSRWTSYMHASVRGHVECLRLLCAACASPRKQNLFLGAAHFAIAGESPRRGTSLAELAAHGLKLDEFWAPSDWPTQEKPGPDYEPDTLAMAAAKHGDLESLQALATLGADLGLISTRGGSALARARELWHREAAGFIEGVIQAQMETKALQDASSQARAKGCPSL